MYVDDRRGPRLGPPLAPPGEQHLIEAERSHSPEPVGVVHQGCPVGHHGIVDRVPISAEIVGHVFDRAAMTTDLLGRPPAGTVRHRQARRSDCGHLFGPRPHRTRRLWTQPAVLAPHQTCPASETRKVHQHHDRAILHPHPTPQPPQRGLAAAVSTCTRNRPASSTPSTFTAGRPTNNSHMRVGSSSTRALHSEGGRHPQNRRALVPHRGPTPRSNPMSHICSGFSDLVGRKNHN